MEQLLRQHPLYCHQQEFFLLFLLWYCCTLIRSYIVITTFRYAALSTWVLFHWCNYEMVHNFLNVYFLISYFCIPCCFIYSCFCDYYCSLHKYGCIIIVTETWLHHRGIEFDLFTCFASSLPCERSLVSTQFLVLNFNGWSSVLSSKSEPYWYSILAA